MQIIKALPYISPSSYMSWLNCEQYTYFTKCSGLKLDRDFQTKNAALGTVFDIVTKSYICTRKGWPLDRKSIWRNLDIPVKNWRVVRDGITLSRAYCKLPDWGTITAVDLVAAEDCEHNGIPIFGYPDAAIQNIPLDWKTTGYLTSYSVSPNAGYSAVYDLKTRELIKNKHKRCGEPLDHLNKYWGIQCLFYSWMLNNPNPSGHIRQLVYQKKRTVLAKYFGEISQELQREVEDDLSVMWEQCHEVEFTPSDIIIPSSSKCIRYGRVCEVAAYCEEFKDWRENEIQKKTDHS